MKTKSTKRTTKKAVKEVAPKVRKTFVLNYINDKGHYKQEYFQSRQEAMEAKKKKSKKNHPVITSWVDSAESLRLARLGYTYDSNKDKAVKPSSAYKRRNLRDYVKWIDSMSPEEKKRNVVDYRNFKNSDELYK